MRSPAGRRGSGPRSVSSSSVWRGPLEPDRQRLRRAPPARAEARGRPGRAARSNQEDWSAEEPPLLYGVWWLFFVVLNFVYNAALRLDVRAEELEELQLASLVTIVADGLSVAGALLALAVVRQTTRRQEARAERLRSDIVAPPE